MRLDRPGQDRTVGQTDLKLGRTYGWDTTIYWTGGRKRQKEANLEINEAIPTSQYAGPSFDKHVLCSRNMPCKSFGCGRLKRLLQPLSSASNASLMVYWDEGVSAIGCLT